MGNHMATRFIPRIELDSLYGEKGTTGAYRLNELSVKGKMIQI